MPKKWGYSPSWGANPPEPSTPPWVPISSCRDVDPDTLGTQKAHAVIGGCPVLPAIPWQRGAPGFVLRGIVSVLAVYAVFVGCLAFFAVRVLYNIQVDNWVVTSGVSFRTWGELGGPD